LKAWSLFSSSSKYDDACELYDKAAAQFKIDKEWEKAGQTYVKAAEICEKQKNFHEATQHYMNAAKAFKNANPKDAVKMYTIAITLQMDNNRFSSAAKLWKEVAQLEEKQMHTKEAIKAWSECATCFEADDAVASANQAHLKVAELVSADEEDYPRAIAIYEKVAAIAAENTLSKYSVKDYMFKASLLRFAEGARKNDMKSVTANVEKYKDTYPIFEGTRECKLIESCLKAFEDEDVEKFTLSVRDYDRITRLDNWTAKILLDIKAVLQDGNDNPQVEGVEDLAEKMM